MRYILGLILLLNVGCASLEDRWATQKAYCKERNVELGICWQAFKDNEAAREAEEQRNAMIWSAALQNYGRSMQQTRPINCTTYTIGGTTYTNCY